MFWSLSLRLAGWQREARQTGNRLHSSESICFYEPKSHRSFFVCNQICCLAIMGSGLLHLSMHLLSHCAYGQQLPQLAPWHELTGLLLSLASFTKTCVIPKAAALDLLWASFIQTSAHSCLFCQPQRERERERKVQGDGRVWRCYTSRLSNVLPRHIFPLDV